jgi:hypothetical protein
MSSIMALASSKDKQSPKSALIENTLQQSENLGLIAANCFMLIDLLTASTQER